MKRITWSLLVMLTCFVTSCKDDDNNTTTNFRTDSALSSGEINSFIYRGLNAAYLFKDEAPDFAQDRFDSNEEFGQFLIEGGSPESFFEKLTVPQDRFSFIISDFEILENFFRGDIRSSGLQFEEFELDNGERYIVIIDVIKNSPADDKNVQRGMIFNRINGAQLDVNNRIGLFRDNSFTIGQAKIENGQLIDIDNEISLDRIELTENPIAIAKTITEGSHKIGYLQYNGFVFDFEEQLNNEFATFKTEGVTDFVLDLRYNGGGAIITANALAGMITGQFNGQVFSKRQWNNEIQQEIESSSPENLVDNFVSTTLDNETPLNSLGLNKLYVITSKEGTASASELVINSLSAYIDVIVIGDELGTVGKSQASITLYDSESFSKDEDLNPAHKYVIQPLVFRTVNKNGNIVPNSGIVPNISANEDPLNLGILGDPNEPLLKIAIDDITGNSSTSAKRLNFSRNYIGNQSMYNPTYQRMYDFP